MVESDLFETYGGCAWVDAEVAGFVRGEGDRDDFGEVVPEAPVAVGVTSAGGLVEVFATDDGATWTIVVTTPQGRSCMVAAGEGWRAVPWTEAEPET